MKGTIVRAKLKTIHTTDVQYRQVCSPTMMVH